MRRLKTLRRPPIYPKTPGHLPCSSLTHPLPLSSRRPSVSFGGFGFSLLDESCDAALAQGRRDAALQAEKDADGLAEALGVDRGGVVGVLEYTSSGSNYGAPVTETCGGQFQDPYTFLPFDAEPRIEVAVQLQISYAISE